MDEVNLTSRSGWAAPRTLLGLLVVLAAFGWSAPAHADTFVVKSTADGGTATLRRAITQANGNAGADTIRFRIPGGGVKTIKPQTRLPEVTGTVTVNGYSQPGASPNTLGVSSGDDAVLLIQLNGVDAGAAAPGLTVRSTGSTIKGLVINRFGGDGVRLQSGAAGNTISGNFIGTDAAGTGLRANEGGVAVLSSDDNTIGGVPAADRNLISGNDANGVLIEEVPGGSGTTGNQVIGNYIGTDRTGTAPLGNAGDGVTMLLAARDNVVGGTAAGARNVISGNGGNGVRINGNVADIGAGNQVLGNLVGTDASGAAALGNSGDGVNVQGARDNSIGGGLEAARNVISANGGQGVDIAGVATRNNLVFANHIGTDEAGSAALGNGADGVQLTAGAQDNTIGGSQSQFGNVISANGDDGVAVLEEAAVNDVLGNHIGTDAAGTADLGNAGDGVEISNGSDNGVGGASTGLRNLISGNAGNGVLLTSGTRDTFVRGNYIGTDQGGDAALGNSQSGIDISRSDDNVVGGTSAVQRNVISANGGDGVVLFGSDATGNDVQGNFIGLGQNGTTALGNDDGIVISSANGNTIGGNTSGAGNRIAQNDKDGVIVAGGSAVGNSILSNSIFSNGDGVADNHLGIELGANGVAANDTDDGDSSGSANRLQNYPIINSAVRSQTNPFLTTITGSLNSNPNQSYTIQCFVAGPTPDPSLHGEGQIPAGATTATTDAGGDDNSFTCVSQVPQPGQFVTATATNIATGDTSEFALNVGVTPGP